MIAVRVGERTMKASLLFCLTLTACGVADVGTTAVTTAKLQADQAAHARELQENIPQKLEIANTAMRQHAEQLSEKKE